MTDKPPVHPDPTDLMAYDATYFASQWAFLMPASIKIAEAVLAGDTDLTERQIAMATHVTNVYFGKICIHTAIEEDLGHDDPDY
jgi:hypothetical protein